MKKYRIVKLCSIILLAACILALYGCSGPLISFELVDDDDYFESGYFMCSKTASKMRVIIGGLTEEGKQLEEIVIPNYIDGMEVMYLGYSRGKNYFFSGIAKKLFWPGHISLARDDLLQWDPPLEKLIFLSYKPNFKAPTHNGLGKAGRYIPALAYENYLKSDYVNMKFANISYMNNYDNTLNGGYHWIDDIETGEKIKTVPPEPEREGYSFGGWYKESNCIHPWNFETDTKGEAEVILYAKWTV